MSAAVGRIIGRPAEMRAVYMPLNPASRTTYEGGQVAQCDLGLPDVDTPADCMGGLRRCLVAEETQNSTHETSTSKK